MRAASPHSPTSVESLLRTVGGRVTPARVRVLSALLVTPVARSHAEIEGLLDDASQPHLDRVTLYRVLEWLADTGLAHRTVDSRGVFRFAAARSAHADHLHFRCTTCGGVFCLDVPPPPPPALPEGFSLTAMDLDVSGQCALCGHSEP